MNPHITVAVNLIRRIDTILMDRKFWLFKSIVEDALARQEIYRILGPYPNHRILSGRAYYHLPRAENLRTLEILTLDSSSHAHNFSIRLIDTAEDAASLRGIVYIEDWEYVWEDKPNSVFYYTSADCTCVYISEKDIFGGGKTVYRAGFPYAQDDVDLQVSCPSLFVNAAINDGSEIAGLMGKIADQASTLSASDPIGEQIARTNKLFTPEISDDEYAQLCKRVFDLLSPLYHYELDDVIAQLDIPQKLRNALQKMLDGVNADAWRQWWYKKTLL